MRRFVVFLAGMIAFGHVWACSCTTVPVRSEDARAASNVFVFRLLSAQVKDGREPGSEFYIRGKIQVLANVRGTTSAREIDYRTHQCCGIRMEVGKDYIGFLSADAGQFTADAGNVLPVWGTFGRENADLLEAVLRGGKEVGDAFSYGVQEIMQVRPPPPPCPR